MCHSIDIFRLVDIELVFLSNTLKCLDSYRILFQCHNCFVLNSHCKNRQFFRNTYQKIEYLTENLHLLGKSQGNELPTSLCLGISLSFSMSGTIKQQRVKVGDHVRHGQFIAPTAPTSVKNSFDMAHSPYF